MRLGLLLIISLGWVLWNRSVAFLCHRVGHRRVKTVQQTIFSLGTVVMSLATLWNYRHVPISETLLGDNARFPWATATTLLSVGFFVQDLFVCGNPFVIIHHLAIIGALLVSMWVDRHILAGIPFFLWSEFGAFLYCAFVLFVPSNRTTFGIYNLIYCMPRVCILVHYHRCLRFCLENGMRSGTIGLGLIGIFLVLQLYSWWSHVEGWCRGKSLEETSSVRKTTPTPTPRDD